MVVQKTIDNLKGRPKDERVAVAGGVAVTVMIILFLGWAIYFFHEIRSGAVKPTFQGAGQQFDAEGLQQAQAALDQEKTQGSADLTTLPDQAAQQQIGAQQQMQVVQQSGGTDQFGNSNSGY